MKKILTLFYTFLKIGAFTFGGGLAMLPLIHKELVINKKWISDRDMLEMITVAESTPGVIAVNSATYVGYVVAGFWGALVSTLGVVLPSLIIIIAISTFYNQFLEIKTVEYIFNGIRAGVIVLILNAVIRLYKVSTKNIFSYSLIVLSLILSLLLGASTIFIILIGAFLGTLYSTYTLSEVEYYGS